MKIGIFGGTFNPPHLAHLIIAETVREQFDLDRVLWIPSARPPHKDEGVLAEAADRAAMTRLAISGNTAFKLSEIEMERDGPSFTIDTVEALRKRFPEDDHALIIGGDSLRDFGAWLRPEDILVGTELIVYRRRSDDPGEVAPEFAARAQIAKAPLLDISGTAIRERCRSGLSIRYLVPEAVGDYIREHHLYL